MTEPFRGWIRFNDYLFGKVDGYLYLDEQRFRFHGREVIVPKRVKHTQMSRAEWIEFIKPSSTLRIPVTLTELMTGWCGPMEVSGVYRR